MLQALVVPTALLAALFLTQTPEPSQPAEIFSRAVALQQGGDFAGAATLYEEVLRLVPAATQVRSNLGAAYAGLGRFEDAISEYRRALDAEDHPAIRQNLALALQKVGRYREAAEEALRVHSMQLGNRDVTLLLADNYLRLGEDAKIVDLLSPLATAQPSDKAVAYLLGTALLNLDRTAEAQRVMDPLFRSESPEAHVLIGALHAQQRAWPEALAELEAARAVNPSLPLVNYLVGDALMRGKQDWAGATAAFRAELERNPNHYESNLLLGNLLLEGGHLEEALPLLERAARLRGDEISVKYPLGSAYLAAGRLGEAKPLLEAMAAAAPKHQPTQLKLAVLYTKLAAEARETAAASDHPSEQQEAAVLYARLASEARAKGASLQREADSRAFEGGKEALGGILPSGTTERDPAPSAPTP